MGENEKGVIHLLPLILGTVVLVIILVVFVNFLGGQKNPPQVPKKIATSAASATAAAQVKTNPFDTYKNPFEKYTNPFSQFKK